MEKPRQVFLAGAFVSIDEQVRAVAYMPLSGVYRNLEYAFLPCNGFVLKVVEFEPSR